MSPMIIIPIVNRRATISWKDKGPVIAARSSEEERT